MLPSGLVRRGSVATTTDVANKVTLRGVGVSVWNARMLAIFGLLLSGAGAVLAMFFEQRRPNDPVSDVRARHADLIVPIAGITYDSTRPPIDVTTIDAILKVAIRSERLILHHHLDGVDTYLVDDEGTLYRYQSANRPKPEPVTVLSGGGHRMSI